MQIQNSIAERWKNIGKSIFSEMSALAQQHNAINLGQGFPDFSGPQEILHSISNQLVHCHNQYSPPQGESLLRVQVAKFIENLAGVTYDPNSEVTITHGATEALFSSVTALVNQGDKVLLFEPAFDLYYQAIANAGGTVVPFSLKAPDISLGSWTLDWSKFEAVCASGIKLAIFNSPHNPTGKVFTEDEILRIASIFAKHGIIAICDEVYENLVYEPFKHFSLSNVAKIRPLVIRISSAGKTFGFTGLRTGWVCAPANITEHIRIVHQATVFCLNPYTQLGLAEILSQTDWLTSYLSSQRKLYQLKRDFLTTTLEKSGYLVSKTEGTFFITANYKNLGGDISDIIYTKQLLITKKIATIPLSSFYQKSPNNFNWVRFAFCKKDETLIAASKLL
ncbi:aminotransferase class I/II-fold pyridoxal phosphate-dependent enzyme [Pigmentibacter sp. JX0631]|uniref:aminotransferase class I/II-fold pyridoxal phosphate-dependent enzyme n=1 Tax=Pigmentibacter sp. JX0631 TaxID=2976982 RepID=UPI002468DA7C|nr:aminotransferase class I/II-fold pyridoxal phosphate-dependent enzyme [Pigmentibacter sp. JX0631]WGL60409.1 aminotransferase class I/II-fold pyridoxal phosphate-dependent enzyme [Pigmentibacter sp. JX0631]